MARSRSPTSSRKSVEPCACSKRPMRRATAPVNAPFSWPKNSLSMRSLRDRRAVHGHERPLAARRAAVDGARDELLARAGLAAQEHRRVRVRHLLHHREHLAHRGRGPHDLLEPGRLLELAAQPRDVAALALVRDRVAEHERELVVADRLREVVERALAHRLHRGLDGRVRGDEHDRERGPERVDPLHERDAVHVRHLEVGDDRERDPSSSRRASASAPQEATSTSNPSSERFAFAHLAGAGVVVHDEDEPLGGGGHGHGDLQRGEDGVGVGDGRAADGEPDRRDRPAAVAPRQREAGAVLLDRAASPRRGRAPFRSASS